MTHYYTDDERNEIIRLYKSLRKSIDDIISNEDVVKIIQDIKDCEICTADVAYLLFDIADIDFNYNIKSKSLIDNLFIPHNVIINQEF